jgi:hypothetical protein
MEKIKNSLIAGVVELIVTHPLDYYKNLIQNNYSNPVKRIIINPLVGIKPKIIGLIPMRMSFWLGLDYCNSKKYNLVKTSFLMGTSQIIIDYPLEQLKINQIFNSTPKNYLGAVLPHYGRNLLFVSCFLYSKSKIDNPFVGGAVGGLVGSIISHPLDSLKTYFQSGQIKYPQWKLKNYFRGLIPRASICLVSMSIGYGVFTFLKKD